ncbi:Sugar phosphate permease [Kosakonia sacchari]|nr:Sugar phosphate permease [Kosakonia sacchari]
MIEQQSSPLLNNHADVAAEKRGRHHFGAQGWNVIIFQGLLFWIAAGTVTHGLNVVLPTLSGLYGLDYSTLLALATPASWASIFASPACAWLCEKRGVKFNIIVCLIGCALCFGALGYSASFLSFVLLFGAVSFFGTGFAYVGGTALIANWFVRKQGLALGWCAIGQTLSSAFYVPALAALFVWLGVRYGFWGISAMMLIMAGWAGVFIANKPEDVGLTPDNEPLNAGTHKTRGYVSDISIRQLLRMRDVWLIGIATGGIYIMLVGVVGQFVPRIMAMGYPQSTAIFYMTVAALIGAPGAYGWGWLNHRLGVKRTILLYTLCWVVAIIVNMFAQQGFMLWLSLLMIGLCMPGATNLSTALIAAKFPRQHYIRAIAIVMPIQSVVRCCAFLILSFGLSWLGGYTGAYQLLVAVGGITLALLWCTNISPMDREGEGN